jgi:hypothetical protein
MSDLLWCITWGTWLHISDKRRLPNGILNLNDTIITFMLIYVYQKYILQNVTDTQRYLLCFCELFVCGWHTLSAVPLVFAYISYTEQFDRDNQMI